MRVNYRLVYVLYSLIIGSLIISGCAATNMSPDTMLAGPLPQDNEGGTDEILEGDINIEAVIQQAESHYDKGCEYFQNRQWFLAQQEFSMGLEILLEADIDAETHYKLGKTYNRLFYQIHKLELERLAEEQELLQQYDALPIKRVPPESSPQPPQDTPQEPSIPEFPQLTLETLGEVEIDPNDQVIAKYVAQFSRPNTQFSKGLERASKYLPMIRRIFASYQIPQELVYLPLIESNFRVDAVSPAGAAGLWQFVRSTGKVYDLRLDKWVDERRDPEKATEAAARYLRDLYGMLGCWDLALAGYYMGEYKVHNAIGRYRTRDFEELVNTKTFSKSAKYYVARFKAAALVAQQPEEYGVNLISEPPLEYDRLDVKTGIRLKDLAAQYGLSYQELRALNPELMQATVPPGKGTYTVKVPVGAEEMIQAHKKAAEAEVAQRTARSSSSAPSSSPNTTTDYQVRRGDTLAKIARRYGISVEALRSANNISNVRALQIGQSLTIPTDDGSTGRQPQLIVHVVRKGETLNRIAKRYNTSVEALKSYNNVNARRLQIGQELQVPLAASSVLAQSNQSKLLTYRVKRGDSLSKIASTFGVSVNQLCEWNNFPVGMTLYPGNRVKVWY